MGHLIPTLVESWLNECSAAPSVFEALLAAAPDPVSDCVPNTDGRDWDRASATPVS